jgi:transcriptional regulator with XRE-family HTH domain
MIDRDRLKSEMTRQRVSQAALAGAVGVSPAAIQQILNGKTRRPRAAREIARILGVSQDWLEGVTDDPAHQHIDDIKDDDLVPIAVPYFTTQFDVAITPSQKVARRLVLFSRSWIRSILPDTMPKNIVMMRFTSRSMAPTILPGDDVMIVTQETFDGEAGTIWLFDYDDQSLYRRVRRGEGDTWHLFADNPATPALDVPASAVRFFGKVVWQGRSLSA